MSMADHVAIGVETLVIDNGCSLEKECIELIHMNPWMVLCQIINQPDSCHGCIRGPLTWDTKDILWMNDHFFTMTYESLAMRSLKHHRLVITWSPWKQLNGLDGIICPWYKRRSAQGMRCS